MINKLLNIFRRKEKFIPILSISELEYNRPETGAWYQVGCWYQKTDNSLVLDGMFIKRNSNERT